MYSKSKSEWLIKNYFGWRACAPLQMQLLKLFDDENLFDGSSRLRFNVLRISLKKDFLINEIKQTRNM